MGEGLRPARLAHRRLRQNCRCHADKVFAAQNGHTISVTIRPLMLIPAQRVSSNTRRIRHYPPADVGRLLNGLAK